MVTLFTRIIDGEIPGTFVWRDDRAVAFMSINPLATGHVLVVPRAEVDHWVDAEPGMVAHLVDVAREIAIAQRRVFTCERIGLIVAGFEVPHLHVHVVPVNTMAQLSFEHAAASVRRDELEAAAEAIRIELRAAGRAEADA
jgi:histidine triad (HIT) family protein